MSDINDLINALPLEKRRAILTQVIQVFNDRDSCIWYRIKYDNPDVELLKQRIYWEVMTGKSYRLNYISDQAVTH